MIFRQRCAVWYAVGLPLQDIYQRHGNIVPLREVVERPLIGLGTGLSLRLKSKKPRIAIIARGR